MDHYKNSVLSKNSLYYIIWTVIFGIALAFGGSALELFSIPVLSITFASPYVALIVTLNKLFVFRKFSVTWMYAVAGTIAIFTTYLGPPSPLKPIFILAGLSFDLATFLRTTKLNFFNLILGHLVITITGFFLFWVIFTAMIPGSSEAIIKLLFIAAPFHFLVSLPIAYIVFKFVPSTNPPKYVKQIRAQISGNLS